MKLRNMAFVTTQDCETNGRAPDIGERLRPSAAITRCLAARRDIRLLKKRIGFRVMLLQQLSISPMERFSHALLRLWETIA